MNVEKEKRYQLSRRITTTSDYYTRFVPYGLPIYIGFGALDIFYLDNYIFALIVRAIFVFFALAFILPFGKKFFKKYHEACPIGMALAMNFSIVAIIYNGPDPLNNLYFIGMLLVSSGASAIFELRMKHVIFVSLLSAFVYAVALLPFAHLDFRLYIVNLFFTLGGCAITIVQSLSNNAYYDNSFGGQKQLRSEVFNREAIIQQKTKELLKHELLSQQFSPQILKMIKIGQLKIEDKFHKALVTVVVVDIVNSTKIMGEIDPDKGNHVIEMVYDIITKTFLKWDLTIEKFTGDGVMAFSNDPVSYHDHTYRAVMACKEVKEQFAAQGDYLQRYWGQPLGLRYGIHTGRATIGFVGNGRIRAYAALGVDVNLTHRICSECPTNEILLSDESWFSLNTQNTSHPFSIKKSFAAKLKGFENEVSMKVVEADNSIENQSSAELTCDKCGNELYISQVRGQAFVTRCRNCDDNKTQINFKRPPKAA